MVRRVSKCDIIERMKRRILLLDGAMGTMIQKMDLTAADFNGAAGNNDILNITRGDVIEKIHREYIEAGADIIETNTFSGTAISQQDYHCQDRVYEINYKGALLARKAVEGTNVLVAGAMGPTIKMLSFSPDVNRPEYRSIGFDQMVQAYREQVRGLIDGGVDILLVETVYDGLNAKAALYAIEQLQHEMGTALPVMVSATVNDKSGRLLSGQKIEALFTALSHFDIMSFGLNCSFGAKELMPFMEQLAGECFGGMGIPCATSIYPNAGLPNEMGQYDESPEFTANCIKEIAQKGILNIAGGCCGTTPAHIRAIRSALEGVAPRKIHTLETVAGRGGKNGEKSGLEGESGEGDQLRLINEGNGSGTDDRKWNDRPGREGTDGWENFQQCNRDDLWVSGLENLLINKKVNNFINVGERTNVAGSAKFAKLIREKAYDQAADIARRQIEDGATVIDMNMDDAMLDSAHEMETFIRYISNDPDIAKVPFMIDSSNWNTIVSGLKNCGGKCIVNSLSLKEGEEEFVKKATEVYLLGAAVIVMAFDEQGQAVTYTRKIEICRRAYDILTQKVGYAPQDIIFDVNILTIATGLEEHDNYAVDYIKAVKWIKENLPGCKTSGGVSNLSFAFRGNNRVREAMHSVFLYHAIQAGLDMAIVNPSMLQVYDEIEPELLKRVEAVVLNDISLLGEEASLFPSPTEALIELAEQIKQEELALKAAKENGGGIAATGTPGANGFGGAKVNVTEQWREKSLEERLGYALIKGITGYMEQDIAEALTVYSNPVEIIEGPLMRGMDRIGTLFGEGKMFLPQVVKSAKAMKVAVSILQPEIEKHNVASGGGAKRGKIILATAKGDVHDIGKNIVGIVLACNNFEVIDLGVMVENTVIIEEAIRHKADIIGISGLITPSLEQMENLCRMLEKENNRIVREIGHPIALNVGGATTSSVHTAVKLAPLYSYCVVYGSDASKTAGICKRIMQDVNAGVGDNSRKNEGKGEGKGKGDGLPDTNRIGYVYGLRQQQEEIRQAYYTRNIEFVSLEQARKNAPVYPLESFLQPADYGEHNLFVKNLDINKLLDKVDWTAFFNFWGFKGKYPEVLYTLQQSGQQADELFEQAMDCVAGIAVGEEFDVAAVVKFYDAYSKDDEIVVLENYTEDPPDSSSKLGLAEIDGRNTLCRFPMPRQQEKGSGYLCAADYFPKAPYTSKIGLIVVKVEDKRAGEFAPTDFEYLLRQSLCARFTEAMAQWVTEQVAMEQQVVRAAFGYPMCPDHALKKTVFDVTGADLELGLKLTESYVIIPTTSICGLLIAHPDACYFGIKNREEKE